MPIYEYECKKCGRVSEVYQKFGDTPLGKCEHCSGKLQKLISQSTFHLKGSGWYVTDYGAGSSGGKSSSEEKPKKTTQATEGKKKEKKESASTP